MIVLFKGKQGFFSLAVVERIGAKKGVEAGKESLEIVDVKEIILYLQRVECCREQRNLLDDVYIVIDTLPSRKVAHARYWKQAHGSHILAYGFTQKA